MEPFNIKKIENEPIFIVTITQSYKHASHFEQLMKDVNQALDVQAEKVFLICDIANDMNISVNDLILGSNAMSKMENAILKHPKIKKTLLASKSSTLRLVAKGLSSTTFGNINVEAFDTLNTAIEYIHSHK